MRILSFSNEWVNYNTNKPKVEGAFFTTWRFPRRDRDWEVGESVQVFYRNRSKNRRYVCDAEIKTKTSRWLRSANEISDSEARLDGFENATAMYEEFEKMHGKRLQEEKINSLLLMRNHK